MGEPEWFDDYEQSDSNGHSGLDTECMYTHTEEISLHELLAIHTYGVDSDLQPNEAMLSSLRKIGSRASFPGSLGRYWSNASRLPFFRNVFSRLQSFNSDVSVSSGAEN